MRKILTVLCMVLTFPVWFIGMAFAPEYSGRNRWNDNDDRRVYERN